MAKITKVLFCTYLFSIILPQNQDRNHFVVLPTKNKNKIRTYFLIKLLNVFGHILKCSERCGICFVVTVHSEAELFFDLIIREGGTQFEGLP